MRVYLDDNVDFDLVILSLQEAGHEVISPRAVGNRHMSDRRHFEFAAEHRLTLLTANAKDFEQLHIEWIAAGHSHTGLLFVHFDHNLRKDMRPSDIVAAIGRLASSGIPLENEVHHLNHWR